MNTSALSCADCSAPNPQWASINRGVLICNECCSVHRSLGRHVSQVRSVRAPNWPPVQKEMVFTLCNKGANSLWEHALHNSSSKVKIKKPNYRDKLQPTRHDFIVSKYRDLKLLPRITHKDNPTAYQDIHKQLHASVRTNNLETCLRLLSLGGNPNFSHPERGNTPLHVAAQAGQAMQVELLIVHGANPCLLDGLGHTPEECARIAGHHQLADRLIETQYELADKLSFFLCGRKPMHSMGEHYLVPNVAGSGLNLGLGDAKSRLQELVNEQFEQLAADVYDEVDRRETDAIWLTTEQLQSSIAFLPVNPALSPLRNQGRQKLATLDAQAFAQLVVDLLLDAKRRQTTSLETGVATGTLVPSTSEDQPPTPGPAPLSPMEPEAYDPHDYDEVPEDEAAASLRGRRPQSNNRAPGPPGGGGGGTASNNLLYDEVSMEGGRRTKLIGGGLIVAPPTTANKEKKEGEGDEDGEAGGGGGEGGRVKELEKKLLKVMREKERLSKTNVTLQKNLTELQKQLNKMIDENLSLRNSMIQSPPPSSSSVSPPATAAQNEDGGGRGGGEEGGGGGGGETVIPLYAQVDKSKKTSRMSGGTRSSSSPSPSPNSLPLSSTRPHSKSSLSSTEGVTTPISPIRQATPTSPTQPAMTAAAAMTPTTGLRRDTPGGNDSAFEEEGVAGGVVSNPSMDVVHLHIKSITQCIQELLQAAQAHKQTSFGPCSAKITKAVDTMVKLFPANPSPQEVRVSLREMMAATQRLRSECTKVSHSDIALKTRQIINSAYDVAKAARYLVLCCEQNQS